MKAAKARIKSYAEKLGFTMFGVAPPAPIEEISDFLKYRKVQGIETKFEKNWTVKSRCVPRAYFPPVKSIICLGLPYCSSGTVNTFNNSWKGDLSCYAWGIDYHIIVKRKLNQLAEYIHNICGKDVKLTIGVDSIPLLEKALAYRAGIGSYGKNCLLYNSRFGSWFFLGEIYLDFFLEPDRPVSKPECGRCTECIGRCPTGAIIEPYSLDPCKCLSYITQVDGIIPLKLRSVMGTKVFGCDVCQKVCPLNSPGMPESICGELYECGINNEVDLLDMLYISNKDFKEKYKNTVIGWAGKKILQRNSAVALGNTGDPAVVPYLEPALKDAKSIVRAHAAWALGQIRTGEALQLLSKALKHETDAEVYREIKNALS